MQTSRTILIVFVAIILASCSSHEDRVRKELETYARQVEKSVDNLETHIKKGRIRNAKLLQSYASIVKRDKPEYAEIVDILAEDAGTKGPLFSSLRQRLEDGKAKIPLSTQTMTEAQALTQEFMAINTAAQANNYNMALSDPLNVLADMSGGKLGKVSDLAPQAAQEQSQAKTGSELIGNPNYGQWSTNSSGDTFWEWYGKYALISRLFDFGGYDRYSYWSSHRSPSYYHDYGRSYYSSPSQKADYQRTETRVKKQFAQQGKKFQSPYARKASSSKFASKSNNVLKQPNKFKSAYSGGSKYANSSKSTKNSSSYNSRYSKSSSRSYSFGGK